MHDWIHNERNRLSAKLAESQGSHDHRWSVIETRQDIPVSNRNKFKGSVIVVDDQSTGRKILTELLQQMTASLNVRCFSDPLEALQSAHQETPDLILTDYKMPSMDGVEFTNQIRSIKDCVDVPLVVITVCEDRTIRYKALEAGATDFITRPIDQHECQARFKNLLTMRKQQLIIKNKANWLADQVAVATDQVRIRERETLACLAKVGYYRDDPSGAHVMRMAKYCRLIAEGLGLSEAYCQEIELAAPLHDIGKVGVPEHILQKIDRLDESEFERVKKHTLIGFQMLKDSPSNYMQLGAIIALNHHETFDGLGYPHGISGEDIPLSARIVAVADVFDVLTSDRPYKKAWSYENAAEYLQAQAGKKFDPECVKAFLVHEKEIKNIQKILEAPIQV